VCKRCGTHNHRGLDRCARCRSTLRGNRLALRTGVHATNATPELREIEAEGERLFEQSITDAGARDELIAREVALHRYRADLHVDILKLSLALQRYGMFDRRGRLRIWLARKESLIGSALAIDRVLGLQRRSRRVPSPVEYWAARSQPDDETEHAEPQGRSRIPDDIDADENEEPDESDAKGGDRE
jgi:hypothetical protein